MFRPLKLLSRNAAKIVSINSSRTKIVYSESFLDKAERMKLWQSDNKLLFGSIIEKPKGKDRRATSKDKRKPIHKPLKVNAKHVRDLNAINQNQKLNQNNVFNILPQGVANNNEIISMNNQILPENISKDVKSTLSNSTNLKSAANNIGKHQIEILTPNVKNGILATTQIGIPSIIIRNLKLFPMINSQKTNAVGISPVEIIEDKILRVVPENTDHKKFPSVTKILDETMPPESRERLDQWKKEKIAELGEEGFMKFTQEKMQSGSDFHNVLSHHFLTPQISPIVKPGVEGAWESVKPLLKNIIGPKAVESHVVHPVLKYRGVVDCIAMYQDKPTLIEWKKSDSPKHVLSATYDNPVQLAAYFGAISNDPNYKSLNVRDALLVIAYSNGEVADFFHLNTDQMRLHWATWLTRLEKFWTDHKRIESEEQPKVESEKE